MNKIIFKDILLACLMLTTVVVIEVIKCSSPFILRLLVVDEVNIERHKTKTENADGEHGRGKKLKKGFHAIR